MDPGDLNIWGLTLPLIGCVSFISYLELFYLLTHKMEIITATCPACLTGF